MSADMRVLSLGGGTQSCALALMSAQGDLPKLDHVIFADTQGELPETYEYLDYLRGVVEAAAIPLHVVTAGNLEADMRGDTERLKVNPTPPAHLLNTDGTKGRVSSYKCSYDYKRRVVLRKIKELCGGRGAWKQATVEQWIGFSLDEVGRMKSAEECRCGHNLSTGKGKTKRMIHTAAGCDRCDCTAFDPWLVNTWPLIDDLMMRRDDTIRWFAANGHPTPPRSACWFCPNSGNGRWQLLRAEHPDLFERACTLDETIRDVRDFKRTGGKSSLDGTPYLHASLVPLRDADLRTARQITRDNGQGELFDADTLAMDCSAGVCFT